MSQQQLSKIPTLPNEMWGHIAKYMYSSDLLNLSKVNRASYAVANRALTHKSDSTVVRPILNALEKGDLIKLNTLIARFPIKLTNFIASFPAAAQQIPLDAASKAATAEYTDIVRYLYQNFGLYACFNTLDNGGRGYRVLYDGEIVFVKISPQQTERYSAQRLFVGKSHICERTVYFGTRNYQRYDGNSLLVQITPNEYVYIGEKVYRFTTDVPIVEYFSPVGRNEVPYPYAIDEQGHTYLMLDKVRLTKDSWRSPPDTPPEKQNDPYIYYVEHIDIPGVGIIEEDGVLPLEYNPNPVAHLNWLRRMFHVRDVYVEVRRGLNKNRIRLTDRLYTEYCNAHGKKHGFQPIQELVMIHEPLGQQPQQTQQQLRRRAASGASELARECIHMVHMYALEMMENDNEPDAASDHWDDNFGGVRWIDLEIGSFNELYELIYPDYYPTEYLYVSNVEQATRLLAKESLAYLKSLHNVLSKMWWRGLNNLKHSTKTLADRSAFAKLME